MFCWGEKILAYLTKKINIETWAEKKAKTVLGQNKTHLEQNNCQNP